MAWALDLDGVVWLGDRAVPGAAEAVARLQKAGEQVLFVTNNSGRTVAEVTTPPQASIPNPARPFSACAVPGRPRNSGRPGPTW